MISSIFIWKKMFSHKTSIYKLKNILNRYSRGCAPLQWCQMKANTFQFTCILTVCAAVCWNRHQMNYLSYISLTLCEENLTLTSGFPSQRASNVESISLSRHHHDIGHLWSVSYESGVWPVCKEIFTLVYTQIWVINYKTLILVINVVISHIYYKG